MQLTNLPVYYLPLNHLQHLQTKIDNKKYFTTSKIGVIRKTLLQLCRVTEVAAGML